MFTHRKTVPAHARLGMTMGTALAAVLSLSVATLGASSAQAQNPPVVTPSETLTIAVGRGSLVRLDTPITDVFVANQAVADVQVQTAKQLYLFGKAPGETTIYATDKAGRIVWSTNVRVGKNMTTVEDMLRVTMPEAAIAVTPMNGILLLTGTVATPGDVEEANRLVQAFVGEETKIISRLKTATPLQVNLQVKIVEVSRDVVKAVGVNFLSNDTSATSFNIAQGEGITIGTGAAIRALSGSTFRLAGKFLGLDIISAITLAENDGLATTLAEPNLTALSGETASFLAGGEIPIIVPQSLGVSSIEYKQYGISLAFTPYVLSDGRISMRVRPEVSQLAQSTVSIGGFSVPGLTTRRIETTVELGSGQSFVIGGLLSNNSANSVNKTPLLGDLPILGALFRSTNFRRSQTELVIVVTPYLVKPVSANKITLPTDGYRNPTDVERLIEGQSFTGQSGPGTRPMPRMGPPRTIPVSPGVVTSQAVPGASGRPASSTKAASARPGFSL